MLAPEPLSRAQWLQFARLLDELVAARHAVAGIAVTGSPAGSTLAADPARQQALRRRFGGCDRYVQTAPLHPLPEPPDTMEPTLELCDAIADLDSVASTLVAVAAAEPSWERQATGAAFAAAFDSVLHGRVRDLQQYVYAVMQKGIWW